MTTTSVTHPNVDIPPRQASTGHDRTSVRNARVWTIGVVAGAVAAVATSLVAVLAAAAGEEIAISGEPIPASGFATLTMVGAVFGIAIAKLVQRTHDPRASFVKVTAVLTALSIIPDALADTSWTGRLLLAATHVLAAAIIVPALAHRLEH